MTGLAEPRGGGVLEVLMAKTAVRLSIQVNKSKGTGQAGNQGQV